MADWFQIHLPVPANLEDALSGGLFDLGAAGVETREVAQRPDHRLLVASFGPDRDPVATAEQVRRICRSLAPHFADQAAELTEAEPGIHPVPPTDWENVWKVNFRPRRIGRRMWIVPTWERHEPTGDELVITLDPGMAFGTGSHATTALCLAAIERVVDEQGTPASLLDVGTGSGILAIGAARLGIPRTVGIDNDPEAVTVARENIEINQVADRVAISGTPVEAIAERFPVVVANILAEPLIQLRHALADRLEPGGTLFLSGLLGTQADTVRTAYADTGLTPMARRDEGEWSLLSLQKPLA